MPIVMNGANYISSLNAERTVDAEGGTYSVAEMRALLNAASTLFTLQIVNSQLRLIFPASWLRDNRIRNYLLQHQPSTPASHDYLYYALILNHCGHAHSHRHHSGTNDSYIGPDGSARWRFFDQVVLILTVTDFDRGYIDVCALSAVPCLHQMKSDSNPTWKEGRMSVFVGIEYSNGGFSVGNHLVAGVYCSQYLQLRESLSSDSILTATII